MKEETNDNANRPSEAQMNDMHKNAWLDFQEDAQKAKQGVNRRYAIMLETYGTYQKMPYGAKEIVKEDYAAYKAKWGENGEEMQKRFGVKESEIPKPQAPETPKHTPEQTQVRQAFLEKTQHVRETQQTRNIEVER